MPEEWSIVEDIGMSFEFGGSRSDLRELTMCLRKCRHVRDTVVEPRTRVGLRMSFYVSLCSPEVNISLI